MPRNKTTAKASNKKEKEIKRLKKMKKAQLVEYAYDLSDDIQSLRKRIERRDVENDALMTRNNALNSYNNMLQDQIKHPFRTWIENNFK